MRPLALLLLALAVGLAPAQADVQSVPALDALNSALGSWTLPAVVPVAILRCPTRFKLLSASLLLLPGLMVQQAARLNDMLQTANATAPFAPADNATLSLSGAVSSSGVLPPLSAAARRLQATASSQDSAAARGGTSAMASSSSSAATTAAGAAAAGSSGAMGEPVGRGGNCLTSAPPPALACSPLPLPALQAWAREPVQS